MNLTSNQKRLVKVLAGAVVYAAGILYPAENNMIKLSIFLVAYLIIGGDILWKALRNILHGQVFDENLLMSIATVGAFIIGEYSEGVAVMLFYQVGELFQSYAVNKSRKSIADLMDIRPDYANVKRGDTLEMHDPDEVEIGEIIVIKPGEKIPLDAVVVQGSATIDASALTGESLPKAVSEGDSLLSGCINIDGLLTARVTKGYGESTISKILDLVENAASRKSQSENFITKFARYYTPAVVFVAVLLAIVPPMVLPGAVFSVWAYRALVFLVVSCPCALVISIPLSFFGGIGGASRRGILVKGSNYLEALAHTEVVVFDKTGTLTQGVFKVQSVVAQGIAQERLLSLAACAETYSKHPIALSLKIACSESIDATSITKVKETPGLGVTAEIDGQSVAVGNLKLMRQLSLNAPIPKEAIGTVVHVAVDGKYGGYIVFADEVKADAQRAIANLKSENITYTVMLTGDTKSIGEAVATQLGLDEAYTQLLPADKVAIVEKLMKTTSPKGKLAFVGDGINDAPVLARADIGVAMGGLGSDAAIEAADVVIMTDEPSKLAEAIKLSKRNLRIVRQNIALALTVKGAVLFLGAVGIVSMWAAVFADVGVAVLAILNAARMLNVNKR